MEHRPPPVGHETAIGIILGLLVSLIVYLAGYGELIQSFRFNGSIFFYLCLPPIVFSSGFNMRRKKFF
jgi:NhaP-type Na+/H+ or K+/H+ antiporter